MQWEIEENEHSNNDGAGSQLAQAPVRGRKNIEYPQSGVSSACAQQGSSSLCPQRINSFPRTQGASPDSTKEQNKNRG